MQALCAHLFERFAFWKMLLCTIFNAIRLILWETNKVWPIELLTSDFRELFSLSALLSNNNKKKKKRQTRKGPFCQVCLFFICCILLYCKVSVTWKDYLLSLIYWSASSSLSTTEVNCCQDKLLPTEWPLFTSHTTVLDLWRILVRVGL